VIFCIVASLKAQAPGLCVNQNTQDLFWITFFGGVCMVLLASIVGWSRTHLASFARLCVSIFQVAALAYSFNPSA
jgi:ABC-type Na+ efflux pump permease subunit